MEHKDSEGMQSSSSSGALKEVREELRQIAAVPEKSARRVFSDMRFLSRILISSADRFYWDNGFSKAASLAYTTLLSLVPLMALAFGLLASFAASNEHVSEVRRFIFRQFVPNTVGADTVLAYLAQFSESISSLNAIVIIFLVLTSVLLLNSVEYALNEVWQVYEPRTIAHRVAIFSAIIVIAPALLVSAYYFATFRVQPILDNFGVGHYLNWVYNYILPFLIDYIAFVSLFFLVPKAPVKLASASVGAFIAALFFAFAKEGYAVYIAKLSSYGTIYTTLAAIPISLFWLYIAWTIILFGVEVSYQAQYLPRHGELWKRSVLSVGDAQLLLAVQSLAYIERAFSGAQPLPSDLELAEALGCSTVVLKPTLDALERANIICRSESREMPLTLMRSPEKITMGDVHQALYGTRRGTRAGVHFAAQIERLFGAFRNRATSYSVTLSDICRGE
ncbi:MAG: YihY family inner membrane protein [Oligoflexia bacterium]|nr:YihY family inner membrane protein [Oligoflexia bacterium]